MTDDPELQSQQQPDPPQVEASIALSGLIVRPGDTLILTCNYPVTLQRFERLRERIHTVLPDLGEILLIDGIGSVAVYRDPHQHQVQAEASGTE